MRDPTPRHTPAPAPRRELPSHEQHGEAEPILACRSTGPARWQIFPRMARDPDLFLVFNLPDNQQHLAQAVLDAAGQGPDAAGVRARLVFIADPATVDDGAAAATAADAACKTPGEATAALRGAGVPVVDVGALRQAYVAGRAGGAIGEDADGPAAERLTVDHWGAPLQRALLRHVLTLVTEARRSAGVVAHGPAPVACG